MGATIPLPALHINPPADPAEGMQKMMALRAMMDQSAQQRALMPGQLQQQKQTLEAGQQENAMRAQQMKNIQAQTAAMHEWDGKSLDELPGLMLKHGATADVVMSTRQGLVKYQQELAAKDKAQLENEAKSNDLLLGHVDAIKGATDPQQRQQVAQSQAAQILGAGLHKHLDPQSQQMIQAIAQGQMVPNDDQLTLFEKGLTGHTAQIEQILKTAETAKNTAQAGEATAQTNKINTEINPNNPADPNIRKQKYEGILQKIQQGGLKAITRDEMQYARSYEFGQRKTTTQSDSLGVTSNSVSTPSGLSAAVQAGGRGAQQPTTGAVTVTSTPGAALKVPSSGATAAKPQNAKDSLVDMVGNYKLAPTMLQRMLTKHPEILGLVGAKYPDWNQPDYNARNALIAKYTSGSQSKEINAINTAMGHVGVLDEAVKALDNGDIKLLNKIGNSLGVQTGNDAVTAFKTIVHRVGPEISSAYVPGGGGQAERFANEEDFSENLSPQQLHSNAAVTVKLLRSKVGALENQYKNTVGREDFQKRFITPEAQKAFDRFAAKDSSGAGMIYARDEQGHLHSAPAGTKLPANWTLENKK